MNFNQMHQIDPPSFLQNHQTIGPQALYVDGRVRILLGKAWESLSRLHGDSVEPQRNELVRICLLTRIGLIKCANAMRGRRATVPDRIGFLLEF